jgi:streptomycin 6-kinase
VTRPEEAAALVPSAFREFVRRFSAEDGAVGGPSGVEWESGLPRLLSQVLDEWELTPVGRGETGWTAVVVPVLRDGERFALKVAWPHIEARDEPLVLRRWDGRGAVRLVAADPGRGALLLEALDPTRDLQTLDIDAACTVAGSLLPQLNVAAPPGLRPLSVFAREQLVKIAATEGALPRRMLDRLTGLVRDLTADPACDATLVHTDLHYENVLASRTGSGRPPWLAIDPHAMAGHPGVEVQPLLRNRVDDYGTGSTFRWQVRRRVEVACEAAGIDEDVAYAWSYVVTAMEARWAAENGDAERVSFNIALLKALEG